VRGHPERRGERQESAEEKRGGRTHGIMLRGGTRRRFVRIAKRPQMDHGRGVLSC
jgi:hypothetical protein